MNLSIINGRLIDPAGDLDRIAALHVAGGRMVAIGEAPLDFKADRVIDAAGLVVIPGLVDLSVRLREPGYEYKATLESELGAAVAAGITSLSCPPDTDPPLDEPGLVEMLKHRARQLQLAHVYPLGALTVGLRGENITEMAELHDAGCIGFAHADAALRDTNLLYRALQYASTFGFPVWLRPQDPYLARDGVAHDGEVATRLGLPGIPATAETVAMATILLLVRETGARVHLCRLSSAGAVDMVRQAKRDGLAVSCDVSINHVHLTDFDIGFFDANAHLVPPLRSQRDRAAIRAGLLDGTIDAVCSDHTPVDEDGKQLPFGESEPGAAGMELLLSLMLRWAEQDKLSLPRALAKVTAAPAQLLGLPVGRLVVGAPADLCIFDPEAYWQVLPETLRSSGKGTPFLRQEVSGRVRYTLVEGDVVFQAAD